MFKERKSFIVAALTILIMFFFGLFNSFIANCIRGALNGAAVFFAIDFFIIAIGIGFALYFYIKNKFEVNDAVVAIVVVTSVVAFLFYAVAIISQTAESISNNLKQIEFFKDQIALGNENAAGYIKSYEQGIANSIVSLIVGFAEQVLLFVLIIFSDEPKKTVGKVTGFFKGLFGKKQNKTTKTN